MYQFEGKRDPFHALVEARASLEHLKQGNYEYPDAFYEQFRGMVESFEQFGGTIGNDSLLIEDLTSETDPLNAGEIPTGTDADAVRDWITNKAKYDKTIKEKARQRYLAMMYLKKCHRSKFGSLWFGLQDSYARGTPQYPENLAAAYSMVIQHRDDDKRGGKKKGPRDNDDEVRPPGHSFLQHEAVPGTDGKLLEDDQCYFCKNYGHHARNCPQRNKKKTRNRAA